eukprot:01947.XXX_22720_23034_1 [CDS] Oithona nana genome sequencing.
MRNCPRLEKPSGSLPSTTSIFVFVILHSPKSAKISFRKCFVELFSNAYHNHKKVPDNLFLDSLPFEFYVPGKMWQKWINFQGTKSPIWIKQKFLGGKNPKRKKF